MQLVQVCGCTRLERRHLAPAECNLARAFGGAEAVSCSAYLHVKVGVHTMPRRAAGAWWAAWAACGALLLLPGALQGGFGSPEHTTDQRTGRSARAGSCSALSRRRQQQLWRRRRRRWHRGRDSPTCPLPPFCTPFLRPGGGTASSRGAALPRRRQLHGSRLPQRQLLCWGAKRLRLPIRAGERGRPRGAPALH